MRRDGIDSRFRTWVRENYKVAKWDGKIVEHFLLGCVIWQEVLGHCGIEDGHVCAWKIA
jgi:hypothetical protein